MWSSNRFRWSLTAVLLSAPIAAYAAAGPNKAPARPAQPTVAEKLLGDIDRKAQEIYVSADKDRNRVLSEAEKAGLPGESSAAATKLAKARNITAAVLKRLSELIDERPVDLHASKTTAAIKAPETEIAEFVKEFRGSVQTATESLIDQEAAEKDAALARKQAPAEEPLLHDRPNAGFQPTARRYERDDDDWEERRLRDRAREAEWEAARLRRDLNRERARDFANQSRVTAQPRQTSHEQTRSNPNRPGQTLREKIGYDKEKKK